MDNVTKVERFRALVQKTPDDELARFTLARALMEGGDLEGAVEQFREVIRMKDDWMMAYILLGRCLVELEEGEEAKGLLVRARQLAIDQDHSDPLVEIDELLEELGG